MNINISLRTFIVAILVGLITYVAFNLTGILVIFFVSFIMFAGMKPLVDKLEEKYFRRGTAILIAYGTVLIIFVALLFFIANQTVNQVRIFAEDFSIKSENIVKFFDNNLPFLSPEVSKRLAEIDEQLNNPEFLQELTSNEAVRSFLGSLGSLGSQGVRVVGGIVGGLFNLFMVVFLSLYMVMGKRDFYKDFSDVLPKKFGDKFSEIMHKIRVSLGSWVVGQLFLMFIIGLSTYIIILVPSVFIQDYNLVRFAFLIALVAGILEAVPNIGPVLTLVFAVLLGILVGSPIGILIYLLVCFFLLQQAEGLFLVPMVMKKAIDLNPIISILAVLAGFELTGNPLGALLAIPFVGVLQIIAMEMLEEWRKRENLKI